MKQKTPADDIQRVVWEDRVIQTSDKKNLGKLFDLVNDVGIKRAVAAIEFNKAFGDEVKFNRMESKIDSIVDKVDDIDIMISKMNDPNSPANVKKAENYRNTLLDILDEFYDDKIENFEDTENCGEECEPNGEMHTSYLDGDFDKIIEIDKQILDIMEDIYGEIKDNRKKINKLTKASDKMRNQLKHLINFIYAKDLSSRPADLLTEEQKEFTQRVLSSKLSNLIGKADDNKSKETEEKIEKNTAYGETSDKNIKDPKRCKNCMFKEECKALKKMATATVKDRQAPKHTINMQDAGKFDLEFAMKRIREYAESKGANVAYIPGIGLLGYAMMKDRSKDKDDNKEVDKEAETCAAGFDCDSCHQDKCGKHHKNNKELSYGDKVKITKEGPTKGMFGKYLGSIPHHGELLCTIGLLRPFEREGEKYKYLSLKDIDFVKVDGEEVNDNEES